MRLYHQRERVCGFEPRDGVTEHCSPDNGSGLLKMFWCEGTFGYSHVHHCSVILNLNAMLVANVMNAEPTKTSR